MSDSSAIASEAVGATAGTPDFSTLRILLADDDQVRRKLAILMLERLGCGRPDLAENGRQAVDAVLLRPYDLVLMDLDLPELDGLEAAGQMVRGLGERRPHIVAMLGRESGDARQRCIDAGVDATIDKPLQRQQLAQTLGRAARCAHAPADDYNRAAWDELLRVFGRAGVEEIVQTLVADVPEQARRYAAIAAAGDMAALKRIAHTLRGTSLQLGADGLATLCTEIEHAAAAGESQRAMSLGASLIQRHSALIERMRGEARGQ